MAHACGWDRLAVTAAASFSVPGTSSDRGSGNGPGEIVDRLESREAIASPMFSEKSIRRKNKFRIN
jgi:hypothetical protein